MFYSIAFFMVPANWFMMIEVIANAKMYCALNIISELINPFKFYPSIYVLKVCIDIPKEIIKCMLLNK